MTDRRALFVNVRRSQIKRWSVTAAYREPTARWLLKTETASLLQRTITPRFFRRYLGRPWRATCASNFGLKFASRLNSLWIGRLGARSAICIGVLVMGTERLPRNKQGRLAELSLRVGKRGDEHSHDMHSLLEENALLRRILVKLDLVLKKVVDSR